MLYVCEECQTMTHAPCLPRDWTVITFAAGFLDLCLCPACKSAAEAFWTEPSPNYQEIPA